MADVSSLEKIFGDWFGEQSANTVPATGGDFTNTGFVGLLMTQKLWRFYSVEELKNYTDDLNDAGIPSLKDGVDYLMRSTKSGYWYYFKDKDIANKCGKALNPDNFRGVNLYWRFGMDTGSVLNWRTADAADKWGREVAGETYLVGLRSKARHEFHLMSLPSLVNAMALSAGLIKERIWHCDEVANARFEDLTDELEWRLIGHPDAKDNDLKNFEIILNAVGGNLERAQAIAMGEDDGHGLPDEIKELSGNVRIHWHYSVLWQRRIALWKALGEDNVEAYKPPQGENGTIVDAKIETNNPALSFMFKVSDNDWTKARWARLHLVFNPAVSSNYSSGGETRRPSIPVISELFNDEAAARAAVEVEGGTPAVASASPTDDKYPPLPKVWDGVPVAQWMEVLMDKKQEVNGKLPATPPARIALAKALECEVDDLIAWWDLV